MSYSKRSNDEIKSEGKGDLHPIDTGAGTENSSSTDGECNQLKISWNKNSSSSTTSTAITTSGSSNNKFSSIPKKTTIVTDNKNDDKSVFQCRWIDCRPDKQLTFSTIGQLSQHLQLQHVQTSILNGSSVCLWENCKVFNQPSYSRNWLEHHVSVTHGDKQPYRCYRENCGKRFGTLLQLSHHLKGKCSSDKSSNNKSSSTDNPARKRPSSTSTFYRNNYIRSSFYRMAIREDPIFDSAVMLNIRRKINETKRNCPLVCLDERTFNARFEPRHLICTRQEEKTGEIKYLVHWHPEGILDDEWLDSSEVNRERLLPLWKLPSEHRARFWKVIFPEKYSKSNRRPRKYTKAKSSQQNLT